jgi:hypothetical protein
MKFNIRENVPMLNGNTPITIKIAALIFSVAFCISLYFLGGMIYAAYLISVASIPASSKLSGDTLTALALFDVAVLAIWALMKGFLIAKLFFRRRWAKNVLSGITLLVFIVIILVHSMHPENASLSLRNNLERVAEVVAVLLLSTPGSRAWFRIRP